MKGEKILINIEFCFTLKIFVCECVSPNERRIKVKCGIRGTEFIMLV